MKLKGKVAVVTGGSRDIGKAVSIKLAAEGAKVVINYLNNETQAAETLAAVQQAGGEAIIVKADVTQDADVAALVAAHNRHLDNPYISW
jgi:3-oxoacyl-[acyl-carrier protein] reductase